MCCKEPGSEALVSFRRNEAVNVFFWFLAAELGPPLPSEPEPPARPPQALWTQREFLMDIDIDFRGLMGELEARDGDTLPQDPATAFSLLESPTWTEPQESHVGRVHGGMPLGEIPTRIANHILSGMAAREAKMPAGDLVDVMRPLAAYLHAWVQVADAGNPNARAAPPDATAVLSSAVCVWREVGLKTREDMSWFVDVIRSALEPLRDGTRLAAVRPGQRQLAAAAAGKGGAQTPVELRPGTVVRMLRQMLEIGFWDNSIAWSDTMQTATHLLADAVVMRPLRSTKRCALVVSGRRWRAAMMPRRNPPPFSDARTTLPRCLDDAAPRPASLLRYSKLPRR